MDERNAKMPNPRDIERKLSEFLSKEFGAEVKVVSPMTFVQEEAPETPKEPPTQKSKINFNLKPEELVSYLDQYMIRQDSAKAVLSTKICTHFNRIKYAESSESPSNGIVGSIKNNVLMIGPTGVGKTYMIKLIAKKIGVPFVKGDATKFSETGYVGGDVEDLVRDLVREADNDIELAQYGIVYIDEIDKIASSRHVIGPDVSRTGVQRALLKPMEETEVDLKVAHDPISVMQEIEKFRQTGKREKRTINTKNILFIMSGAFPDLPQIISKRIKDQGIGFKARIPTAQEQEHLLQNVKAEDLIEFGFESEFIGRLPVVAVLEKLSEDDLYQILKNPNSPVILSKKLDFAAYGIDIRFDDGVLRYFAANAYKENTGARGLVSVIEKALLLFEKVLPSTHATRLPITEAVIRDTDTWLEIFRTSPNDPKIVETFEHLLKEEKEYIKTYIYNNRKLLSEKSNMTLTLSKIDIAASYYCKHIMDVGNVISKIKSLSDDVKKMELFFYKNHDINIVLEEDAIDFIIEQMVVNETGPEAIYQKLCTDFEFGLKLVRDKTGKNRFFITREAVLSPEVYISKLIKNGFHEIQVSGGETESY